MSVLRSALVLLCASASLVLAACGGGFKQRSAPQIDTGVIPQTLPADQLPAEKVALLVPLSGKHAGLGKALLNAAQMALFDVGYTNFELLPGDTKGTAEGAGTDVFVLRTSGDCFSNASSEAMAMKLPVITTAVGGMGTPPY